MNKELMLKKNKEEIFSYFNSDVIKKQMQGSLPKVGITPERLTRVLFTSIAENPLLAECTTKSLYNALIQCAQIGLEPNTALGHAYMIPFKNKKRGVTEAKLILGYKGLIMLCHRSGEISSVYAQEVYADDLFRITLGTDRKIDHHPSYSESNTDDNIIGAYAVITLKDGSTNFEYMPKHQIDKIRARSMAANSGPWVTDYAMMARKTAIKRIIHYTPLSADVAEAVKLDNENNRVEEQVQQTVTGQTLTDQILGIEEPEAKDIEPPKPKRTATPKKEAPPKPKKADDKDVLIRQIYKLASEAGIVVEAIEEYMKVKTLKSLTVEDLDVIINGWDEIKASLLPEENNLI